MAGLAAESAEAARPSPTSAGASPPRAALANHPRIKVTGIEAALGTTYTADTLRKLQAALPGVDLVWMMGADNLATFHRWRDWREIAASVPIAVFNRPGQALRALASPAARTLARARIRERDAAGSGRNPAAGLGFPAVAARSPLSSTELRATRESPPVRLESFTATRLIFERGRRSRRRQREGIKPLTTALRSEGRFHVLLVSRPPAVSCTGGRPEGGPHEPRRGQGRGPRLHRHHRQDRPSPTTWSSRPAVRTGTSAAIADRLVDDLKEAGGRDIRVEGLPHRRLGAGRCRRRDRPHLPPGSPHLLQPREDVARRPSGGAGGPPGLTGGSVRTTALAGSVRRAPDWQRR